MHFLLTTFGSFGDLHPYIAVGLGLRSRGHEVTIGTSPQYQSKVEGEGLRFHPIRPDLAHFVDNPEAMAKAFHPRTGPDYIVRKVFLPFVDQAYEDTMRAAQHADILVSHSIAFATPTVADKLGKPWIGIVLQPAVVLSAYDPPYMPYFDTFLRSFGVGFWTALFRFAKVVLRRMGRPVNRLRSRVGLPALRNPILSDPFSPYGSQAWFSKVLTQRRPDWPAQMEITGFPFYDKLEAGAADANPALTEFLDAGPAPLVFTLGSAAVFTAGAFYRESLLAAKQLGRRAVLLIGRDERNIPQQETPSTVFVAQYARYSQLFPRAAATVHQGGVGTTAQAMRAGKPMLFVPHSHDQPDNAMRVTRLGISRVIKRHHYEADSVARELDILLKNDTYLQRAERIAKQMEKENGVATACDGLEHLAMTQSAQYS